MKQSPSMRPAIQAIGSSFPAAQAQLTSIDHFPYAEPELDADDDDGFQRRAANLLTYLLAEGPPEPDILSLAWTGRLLDTFLLCFEEFRALMLGSGAAAAARPPLDRLVVDLFDRAIKALDICNAVRDGLHLVRNCCSDLVMAASALTPSAGPDDSAAPLGKATIRRARRALSDHTILMLGGCNKDARDHEHGQQGHHRKSSSAGSSGSHLRSVSRSMSRGWSAARQLQAIGLPYPPHIVATGGLASVVYAMGVLLFIVTFGLVAAIPCQGRGLPPQFSVPMNFAWSGPVTTLYERILEESNKEERKNSCGLLKEIHQIELCARHLMEITDVNAAEFLLPAKKGADVRETARELVQIYRSLVDGLGPLERQVREMFRQIVCTRTEILDRLSIPHDTGTVPQPIHKEASVTRTVPTHTDMQANHILESMGQI